MKRGGLLASWLALCVCCLVSLPARGDELTDAAIYQQLSRRADSLLGGQFEPTGLEWSVSLDKGRYLDLGFTMHANVHYRLVVVSTLGNAAVRYRLLDVDRNALFDSQQFGNPSWWDFLLTSTIPLRLNLYGGSAAMNDGKGHILIRVAFCRNSSAPNSVK